MPYDGGSAKVALGGLAYQQISRKALVMPRPNISCPGLEERRAEANVIAQARAGGQQRSHAADVGDGARESLLHGCKCLGSAWCECAPSRKRIQCCRPTPPDDHERGGSGEDTYSIAQRSRRTQATRACRGACWRRRQQLQCSDTADRFRVAWCGASCRGLSRTRCMQRPLRR